MDFLSPKMKTTSNIVWKWVDLRANEQKFSSEHWVAFSQDEKTLIKEFLKWYSGDFPFLVSVKEQSESFNLSDSQWAAVANCFCTTFAMDNPGGLKKHHTSYNPFNSPLNRAAERDEDFEDHSSEYGEDMPF